jgi:hypothetical protein
MEIKRILNEFKYVFLEYRNNFERNDKIKCNNNLM